MTVVDTAVDEAKSLEKGLSFPILLAERLRKSAAKSVTFKSNCSKIAKKVDKISQMLRSTVKITIAPSSSAAAVYHRPIRRVAREVTRNLHCALSLVCKCRRGGFLHRLVNLVTAAAFQKVFAHLDASVADLWWLISVLSIAGNSGDGVDAVASGETAEIVLSLPPIASNNPILSWVWSFTATVQMSGQLPCRVEAANELASLALDNDRNKKIIVEEGGVPPLLKLLKENVSPEAQIAAAIALFNLANDEERARAVVDSLGIPIIVQVLSDSPMSVQIRVSSLVARMAEFDVVAREEFAKENVIRPLVSLLSFETFENLSSVEVNKEKVLKTRLSSLYSSVTSSKYSSSDGGSSRGGVQARREREMESVEVKRELKVNCARALWMLSKDSPSNSRRITETKGLLCLAKLIEKEHGDLQRNCLMTVMEITFAAESNVDLRRSAFKNNSPAAKAVVEQLLRVIKEVDHSLFKIPAIRSIGSLSRMFPARETRVIGPLVNQLSCGDHKVGTEAAIALGKVVSSENFLCQEHAKTIIEFSAVIPLMRLLRDGERTQLHALILICYLAIQASDTQALEQAKVLNSLEGADQTVVAQDPQLRELITQAIYHLNLYRGDIRHLRQSPLGI